MLVVTFQAPFATLQMPFATIKTPFVRDDSEAIRDASGRRSLAMLPVTLQFLTFLATINGSFFSLLS